MIGRVIKLHSGVFIVNSNNVLSKCVARGILKLKSNGIVVGDNVEFNNGVIEKVLPRKNILTRPNVSNIDSILIVVSPIPQPDFMLVDKLLLNSFAVGINVAFAVNKNDIDDCLFYKVNKIYGKTGLKVFSLSASSNQGIKELKDYLQNKLTLFAGQSAVGKTSLVNALFGLNLKTGEVSNKIMRGKHTTTYSEIIEFNKSCIIDSPGFAQIEANITLKDLPLLYPEYYNISQQCKFRSCTHISEPNCEVKNQIENGLLDRERYSRYIEIYNDLLRREKYD